MSPTIEELERLLTGIAALADQKELLQEWRDEECDSVDCVQGLEDVCQAINAEAEKGLRLIRGLRALQSPEKLQ